MLDSSSLFVVDRFPSNDAEKMLDKALGDESDEMLFSEQEDEEDIESGTVGKGRELLDYPEVPGGSWVGSDPGILDKEVSDKDEIILDI